MSKHTPGPWIAICPSNRNFHEGSDITHYEVMTEKTRNKLKKDGFNHYRDDPHDVDNVSIVSMSFWRDMTTEEANANANLIAASPDLLKALKGFVDHFSGYDEVDPSILPLFQFAEDAIAKATGDQA